MPQDDHTKDRPTITIHLTEFEWRFLAEVLGDLDSITTGTGEHNCFEYVSDSIKDVVERIKEQLPPCPKTT